MPSSHFFALLALTSLKLALTMPVVQSDSAPVLDGANNPNEIIYLTQCDGDQTFDEIFYISDIQKFKGGAKPDSSARVVDPQGDIPVGQHIDWTHGTSTAPISANLGSKPFTVWSLDPTVKVGTTVGAGRLDGIDFRCYREDPTVSIVKGTKNMDCKSAFSCTQENRQIRRTKLSLYNQTVIVSSAAYTDKNYSDKQLKDPAGIFGNLKDLINNNKGSQSFDLNTGGNCKITFDVSVPEGPSDPNYVANFGQSVQDYFVNEVAPIIKNTHKYQERPLLNDQVPHWYATYTWPQGGWLDLQVADQANPIWVPQYHVKFTTACSVKCNPTAGDVLKAISGTASAIAGVAGPEVKALFGALSGGASFFAGLTSC